MWVRHNISPSGYNEHFVVLQPTTRQVGSVYTLLPPSRLPSTHHNVHFVPPPLHTHPLSSMYILLYHSTPHQRCKPNKDDNRNVYAVCDFLMSSVMFIRCGCTYIDGNMTVLTLELSSRSRSLLAIRFFPLPGQRNGCHPSL